jgi:hypothetical protein
MGVQNIKFEAEVFQQIPQFQIGATPVETKPDPSLLTNVASQIAQLTATVNQLTQVVVAGQSFTRQAPQAVTEGVNTADALRKLGQRLDDLEARIPRAKEAAKV